MKKSVKNLLILGGIFGTALAIGGSVALASCATSGSTTAQQSKTESTIDDSTTSGGVETPTISDDVVSDVETPKKDVEEVAPVTPSQPTQTPVVSPVQKPTTSGSSGSTTTGTNQKPTTSSNQTQKASLFSRALAQRETSKDETTSSTERTEVKRITKEFTSGMLSNPKVWNPKTKQLETKAQYIEDGKLVEKDIQLYQSPYYYNQRDVMPILSSLDNINYPNERTQNNVQFNTYLGWDKRSTTTHFHGNFETMEYTPTDALKEVYPETAGKTIKAARINLDYENFKNSDNTLKVETMNQYLKDCASKGITFIILEHPLQEGFEKLEIPSGIEKLTIKDFYGNIKSFRGIKIADSVKELEFYSTKANRIDPTVLPDTTHMIFDHIDGQNATMGKLTFKSFEMIDMSNQADLNDTKLQLALDNVYGKRQYERNFQGSMVGGYIYQLDISNTPITSLNNVYIPSQSDGRFNIAYVQWSAGASGNNKGQVSITIGGENKYPGNDANVNEWFDASGWAEKATKLVLNSDGEMFVDQVMTEFSALVKKYPNIVTVDVTNVKLMKSESQEDLAKKVLDKLGAKYAELEEEQKPTLKVVYLDASGAEQVMTNKKASSSSKN